MNYRNEGIVVGAAGGGGWQDAEGGGWQDAEGLVEVTRCHSEHIGSQGGCYFALQSHSPPVLQDILI